MSFTINTKINGKSVSASAGSSTDTQTVSATANQSYDIVPGGSSVTVTTHSANENAWLFFDGQSGRRISLIPTSCGSRLPFRWLQAKQQQTTFSQVDLPPRDRGTT